MAKLVEDYRGVILFLLVFVIMFSIFNSSMAKHNARIENNQYNASSIYAE